MEFVCVKCKIDKLSSLNLHIAPHRAGKQMSRHPERSRGDC